MKEKKLTITINQPIETVFEFTTNPKNTPLWVESIEVEITNEWPAKLGTIYKNHGHGVDWSEYYVSAFEKNKLFELSKNNDPYHVRYTYKALTDNQTELEYFEWMDVGELSDPFTIEVLEKLKTILEV